MAAPPGSTTAGVFNTGIMLVEEQKVALHLNPSNEPPIRIESSKIQDPTDIHADEEGTIQELHEHIQAKIKSDENDKKISSFIWPITGVARSGKTQFARKYVYKHKHEYAHCLWVDASTVEKARESFLDIENELTTSGITNMKQNASVENVYNFTFAKHCLIVFDDIDCGTNLMETNFGKEFFPKTLKTVWKKPAIIVTSKNREWERHGNCRTSWSRWRPSFIDKEDIGYRDPIETFVGRDNVLQTIHDTLKKVNDNENSTIWSRLIILTGMPGIGKSETARKYVSKWRGSYEHFIWITAKSRKFLHDSFLKVSTEHNLTLNNSEIQTKTKDLAREVYKNLCQKTLLIVFDGANSWDSEDENGIKQFLPMDINPGWKIPDIIVTSRNRKWGVGNVIEIEELRFEECHHLLTCGLDPHKCTDTWIVSFLVYWRYGGLPTVAQQFVLNYDRITSDNHLSAFKEYFKAICNYKNFLDSPPLETELQANIFSSLEDVFQDLRRIQFGIYALECLDVMVLLYPANIPTNLIRSLLEKQESANVTLGLNLLHKYCLITMYESFCKIHPVVQLVRNAANKKSQLAPNNSTTEKDIAETFLIILKKQFETIANSGENSPKVDITPYINNAMALASRECLDSRDPRNGECLREEIFSQVERFSELEFRVVFKPTDFRANSFNAIHAKKPKPPPPKINAEEQKQKISTADSQIDRAAMSQCGLPPDLQTPQQYKTDSTNMVGEAQIVRLEAGSRSSVPRKLALNTEILRKVAFDANDYPLAVIAIAGPSQSDNSFMLTCVVRYLQALERAGDRNVGDWMHKNKPDIITKDEGFEFRNRVDQTAEGIWMWTRPFIIKRFETESPIAVVVMATQGCFDPRTNEQDQFSIIGLSLLLSSCFIYNDTRLINENTVSTLTQFMHYGQVASQPFEGKAFQRLLFLIRNCNASGFNHGAVGGQEFIRKCLRMSDDTVRNSKLVEDNFEDYNAYLLPLLGEHMISDDFIGSDGEIKAEVRDHVEKFVVSLVTDVAPKRFGSILASGKTFFHTFENLVTAFNAEDKPSPSSKLDVIVGLDAKISKLTHEYEEQFLQQIESNPASFVSSDTLPKYHQELTLALENKLKGGLRWQICSPKDRQIFANKLHQLLEHKFSEISKQNATKQREFIETTQQSYIQELQDFIKQNMFNTPKIWCRNEYVDKIASFRENIVKEFLKAINGISKEDSKIRRTLISELQEVVHSNWLKLEERKAKADQRATQIIKTWLSHYNMDIDNYVSENGLPNKSTLATLHESNKNSTIQEALNELKKEFVDLDYIRDYENQLEHDIQANFESIKSNLNTQVEEIFGFMKNDLHETVAEFRQQAHIEMQKSSLENANIEAIFERILYKGINSLNSRNHPDHQVVENYTKQLLMDMSTALEEINSLQSRKGRRQECECHFKETTEAFLKEIEVRCPQNDILEEHEVASIVEQLDQSIRPKYERKIQETSPEDYIEFTRNFGEFVAKEKQQIISRNSEKFHQFETRVHGQIKELTETFKLSMKLKEAHWISSDEIISAHNNLMVDLSRRLKSESPLQRYPKLIPKYQNQLEKETQEHFENYISRFELVVRQKNQIVRQIIPEWVSKFQNDIRNDIRSNLFVDKSIIITKIGERTAELVVSLTKYASEAGLNSLFQVEVESILRKEIGNVNVELEIYIKKTTDEYVELIMQSCFQFADNHPILLERSLPELPDFDTAQEKLISDVRGYYDSQWCYPSQSAGQEKATVWDRIHDELMSKCQVLFSELREKSEEESRIVNQITESVLKNVCPTVLNSLNSDRYFEDATLPNLLRDARVAAKNEFQDQVSRKNITLLGYEQTFDEKLDVRLDELSKMNTQITQAAFAEAQEKCNVLFNERRELIKSEVDLSNLRRQAENTVREFLQTKSVVSNTETSLIGSQLHSFIEMLHQKLLEKSIVTSDKAVEVTKDAVRIYSRKMREFRLSRRPVNPENLLEYHHFSWKSTIKRSKKSCFIRNSLDSAIRDRLEYSYEIFQERNYLSHAQDSNFVIGIDLGTTTSCVAVYNNGEVAAITDENGNTLIPCYVYFQEQGSPIAGNEAKDQGIFHPECTIFGAQRMVGRQFNDPQVQNDMKSWPFKIESDNVGGPLIAVKDKRFSPEEVIAEVLRYIKMLAEKHLEGSVTKAVITVPTNFNNSQRGAIRKAASLAGLEVLQIINEPSAAAMAYSLHWKNEEKIILVFNFGDKTFDVTILTPNFGSTNIPDCERSPSSSGVAETVEKTQIQDEESRLQILKIVEDTHLGGDDFNNEMVNYCAETFKHQHGIQLLEVDGSTTGGRDVQQHIRRLGRLKNACEKAKEMLTSADSVTVEVDRMHGDLDLKVPISRSEFERMNENLFQKAITIVKETIEGANLKPQDITDVLTIGGSSRIPRVRKLLQDFLKRPILEINQEVGIQEAVAAGAAIQACVLNGKAAITNLPFSKDIQPFSVGIKLTTGNMSVIIRRNTKIPCEDSRTFSTIQKNQNAISFDIYIGEERVAEDNLFLKTVKLEGIPPAPGDSQNVTVQMKIDANGVLNVTVSTPGGPSSTVTIQDCRGRNSDEELG